MAAIAPQPNPSKWYAVVGIGLALIAPHVMIHGPRINTIVMPENPTQSTLSHVTSVSGSTSASQIGAETVYEIPQNLGLPNRREPGGTR